MKDKKLKICKVIKSYTCLNNHCILWFSCFSHFRNSNSDTDLLDAISQKGLLHFPAERHRNKTPRCLSRTEIILKRSSNTTSRHTEQYLSYTVSGKKTFPLSGSGILVLNSCDRCRKTGYNSIKCDVTRGNKWFPEYGWWNGCNFGWQTFCTHPYSLYSGHKYTNLLSV